MKLYLFTAILPASCVAIPPSQVEDSPTNLALTHVDVAPAQVEPLNTSFATLSPKEDSGNPPCPPGQTFQRSICFTAQIVRRFCFKQPRDPANEDTATIHCYADEVCVERTLSTGQSFAECHKVFDLIRWKTDPVGIKRGCTDVAVKQGKYHHVGTIVYDANSNPIQVGNIHYIGEPGDKELGSPTKATYHFDSELWNFDNGAYVRTCIITAGYGNLNAFTWIW
ncbi:hypothetical protein CCHL11_10407 [Colletotrichum chlorophyti]|uniref:Secreted in xylem 6 n=1 Tax=Colletotrichum chlorophyti TaxID=708187 RepID=A0A1Q8S758_9PEZI|nr:hypothetical protein CCHL11_10407 [Colletotrichum chlorophyti]